MECQQLSHHYPPGLHSVEVEVSYFDNFNKSNIDIGTAISEFAVAGLSAACPAPHYPSLTLTFPHPRKESWGLCVRKHQRGSTAPTRRA